jgi:hypothetical protein
MNSLKLLVAVPRWVAKEVFDIESRKMMPPAAPEEGEP